MPITGITISAVEAFAERRSFGEAGAYVRVRGVARGVLDPRAPENAGIVDLDKAACNAAGLVEYATDFFALRPAEPRLGSGLLVYDVTNRGNKRILQFIEDVSAEDPIAGNDPKTVRDAGLGFLLGRGHSIVWSGWDPGAPRANNGLGADFPIALENGKPITGHIRDEFQAGTRGPVELLAHRLPYPAASLDQPKARLAVRDRESDRRRYIPRGMGICRQPLDPPVARGPRFRAVQDLRSVVRGDRAEGARHRLCFRARPCVVSALRARQEFGARRRSRDPARD